MTEYSYRHHNHSRLPRQYQLRRVLTKYSSLVDNLHRPMMMTMMTMMMMMMMMTMMMMLVIIPDHVDLGNRRDTFSH